MVGMLLFEVTPESARVMPRPLDNDIGLTLTAESLCDMKSLDDMKCAVNSSVSSANDGAVPETG